MPPRSRILDCENTVLGLILDPPQPILDPPQTVPTVMSNLNNIENRELAPSMSSQLAQRAMERKIADRRTEYQREMARIVDATFDLVRRTGVVDPPMREILAETGLSTQAFYRYFKSKDELMLVLLDEGRRRLMDTLRSRMKKAKNPRGRLRAWVEGVIAQAANGSVAARTRPWAMNERRLAELFPEEQQTSVDLLVALLEEPIREMNGGSDLSAHRNAVLVYRLTFATLAVHLAGGTRPTARETNELVAFCLRGAER